jgi:2-polyprenyl-3-methyl-5-hydroxy-6-metoxy-1,4-benzoquinol methylase
MAPGFEPRKVIWDAQKVKRVWDFYGDNPAFDASRFSAHSGSEIVNWAFSRIKPVESTNVDIGCGAGDLVQVLAHCSRRKVKSVQGFEFSSESVERAKSATESLERVAGINLISNDMPIREDFDIAWMIEVVEHLTDDELEQSMDLVKTALKPGGKFVVTTPNEEDIEAAERMCPCCGAIFHPKQHVRAWSAHSLSNFLESKGFVIDARICTNWLDHRSGFFIRRMKSLYRKFDRANYKPHLGIVATLK